MAKASPQRRLRIKNFCLQRLAALDQIVKLSVISVVTSPFLSARATWGQSAGPSEPPLAVASDGHRGCSYSKRRSYQQSSRPPKRQMLRRYEPWC
jgi:hypothetical protein